MSAFTLDPLSTALVLIDLQEGIVSLPVVPRSGEEVSVIVPPWDSTDSRLSASPRPRWPDALVVTNGSNRRSRTSAGSPEPVSVTFSNP